MPQTIFAAVAIAQACSWGKPGHNPYRGDPAAAVAHYGDNDLSAVDRAIIYQKMLARQYDDVVEIRRDSLIGKDQSVYTDLRKMHFGERGMCNEVTRTSWTDTMVERGLVYCASEDAQTCVIVPTVCNNVSLVHKVPQTPRYAAKFEPLLWPEPDEPGRKVTPRRVNTVAEPSTLPLIVVAFLASWSSTQHTRRWRNRRKAAHDNAQSCHGSVHRRRRTDAPRSEAHQ